MGFSPHPLLRKSWEKWILLLPDRSCWSDIPRGFHSIYWKEKQEAGGAFISSERGGPRTANKCFNCETQACTRQKKIKCEENNQVQSSKVFNPMKVLQLGPSSEKNTSAETTLQNDRQKWPNRCKAKKETIAKKSYKHFEGCKFWSKYHKKTKDTQ